MHDLGAANVDAVNEDGCTALMYASANGHVDSVKYLHEMKADLHICSRKFGTAMHRAALTGHTEILKVANAETVTCG